MGVMGVTGVTGVAVLLGVFAVGLTLGCAPKTPAQKPQAQEIDYWTCGMHPEVRSDEPGDCPICGMDLIPVYKKARASLDTLGPIEETPRTVQLSATQIKLAGIATVPVTRRELNLSIRTTGTVEFDERALAAVSARFSGRVERLYVNYEGAVVSAGSPLADIYSPELAAAQQEYLSAAKAFGALSPQSSAEVLANAQALLDASRERLRLWGITDRQISELEKTSVPRYTMTILSPQSGTVTMRHVVEGQYVMAGEPLFEIANPSRVWVQAVVYEQDILSVRVGQHAVFSMPGERSRGSEGEVSFISPVLDEATRSVRVRIQPESITSFIKPGMYVDVDIHVPQGEVLAVPRDAVLDTGEGLIAYVDSGNGLFVARKVEVGPAADGFYPVLAGLEEGERVVARGAFLVDSETRITGGASALYGGASEVNQNNAPAPVHQH